MSSEDLATGGDDLQTPLLLVAAEEGEKQQQQQQQQQQEQLEQDKEKSSEHPTPSIMIRIPSEEETKLMLRHRRTLDDDDNEDALNLDESLSHHDRHSRNSAVPESSSSSSSPSGEWYSNPMQVAAMISNYSTSYNVVNISLVLPILEVLLSEEESKDETTAEDAAAVASSLLAGMMIGQVLGGALGDSRMGRLGALRIVMVLQIVASLGSALAVNVSTSKVYWQLATWRLILGLGAGGVYPLAAVLSAEQGGEATNNNNNNNNNNDDEGNQRPESNHSTNQNNDEQNNVTAKRKTVKCDQVNLAQNNVNHVDDEADEKLRRVVLTFSTQGAGFVTVPLVAVPLLYAFPNNLNLVWRLLLGLGSLPGMILLVGEIYMRKRYFNFQRIPTEPPNSNDEGSREEEEDEEQRNAISARQARSRQYSIGDIGGGPSDNDGENESILDSLTDIGSQGGGLWHDGDRRNANQNQIRQGWWESIKHEENLYKKLFGTAFTWFLFDVLFYGNTLFQPIVIEAAFGARNHTNPAHLLQKTATDSLILATIALPGYALAGAVMGKKGSSNGIMKFCFAQTPRYVMLQGFAFMGLLYLIIGMNWNALRRYPVVLVLLYGLTFFFANYGPNTSTFVLPSLVYSPECRSTLNGICAACGKLGALVGASSFDPAAERLGDNYVMIICAGIAVVAYLTAHLFVPKQKGDMSTSEVIEPFVVEPLVTEHFVTSNTNTIV